MYQKDYILRLIEEAAKFLATILSKGGEKEALEIIDYSYRNIFEIDKTQSVQEIISGLRNRNKHSFAFIELLSDFMIEDAKATNDISLYSKAYQLLLYVEENDKETFSILRKDKLKALQNQ